MESGTEGLIPIGHGPEIGTNLEVESIYERIGALSDERKVQLMRKLIQALSTDEMAQVLDELAIKLRDASNQ